jgi:hypothetical protein
LVEPRELRYKSQLEALDEPMKMTLGFKCFYCVKNVITNNFVIVFKDCATDGVRAIAVNKTSRSF